MPKQTPIFIPAVDTVEDLRSATVTQLNRLSTKIAQQDVRRSEPFSMGNNRLTDLADPSDGADGVNLQTLRRAISTLGGVAGAVTQNVTEVIGGGGGGPSGVIDKYFFVPFNPFGTYTPDFTNGNTQEIVLPDVTQCSINNLVNPSVGQRFTLIIRQGATGRATVNFWGPEWLLGPSSFILDPLPNTYTSFQFVTRDLNTTILVNSPITGRFL